MNSIGSSSSWPFALRISLNAGNFHRILEGEKHTGLRAFLGLHLQQVPAVVKHGAFGDLERRMSGEHLRQRALAGAVRPHHRMHFTGVDREIYAAEDGFAIDRGVEIPYIEHFVQFQSENEKGEGFELRIANCESMPYEVRLMELRGFMFSTA
jgi:hypothetical protein